MWIIDSLKEKKRLRNEQCDDLIKKSNSVIEEYESFFSDKSRFIEIEITENWKRKASELYLESIVKSRQILKKAENHSVLSSKISHLSSLINNLEDIRKRHNEQFVDEKASTTVLR